MKSDAKAGAPVDRTGGGPGDDATRRVARTRLLLGLSYVGFVSLGLPDTVLGAAWPAMRASLGLPLDAAGPIVMLTTAGVVLSSALSGRLRARMRTGTILAASTLLAALALVAIANASGLVQLWIAALTAGLGGGAIDACLNLHVARNHSARHMSWLHACWGVGAAAAPLLAASLLARGASWRAAYATLGVVELLLALTFALTRSLWPGAGAELPAPHARPPPASRSAAAMRASVALFFVYCGIEASAGLWAASLLIETRGLSQPQAGAAVGAYWAALTAGRFAVGAGAERVGPLRALRASVVTVLIAALALSVPGTPAWLACGALALLGFALAPIYPLSMHDTPHRFGDASERLVGQQVAAGGVGIACLPWLIGKIASAASLAAVGPALAALALLLVVLERVRRLA